MIQHNVSTEKLATSNLVQLTFYDFVIRHLKIAPPHPDSDVSRFLPLPCSHVRPFTQRRCQHSTRRALLSTLNAETFYRKSIKRKPWSRFSVVRSGQTMTRGRVVGGGTSLHTKRLLVPEKGKMSTLRGAVREAFARCFR